MVILLTATDNHIGYLEKDPERGRDSLVTFEEILQIAQEKQVYLSFTVLHLPLDGGRLCV